MMEKYFNVKLEFDHDLVDQTIEGAIRNGGKGYVCSVERTTMVTANTNPAFLDVVNGALVNICDGSFVARTIGWAHGRKYKPYIGAQLFLDYIDKRKYKQYFLGNTRAVLDGLRNQMSLRDPIISTMKFETLPFKNVDEFDYVQIAQDINNDDPDIIWVSLGAPKQEAFMAKLLPHINRGVMFGFGAIFNFNSGIPGQQRAPSMFLKFKLEWLYRMFQEPKKNFLKNWTYLRMVPRLIQEERNRLRSH